MPIDFKEIKSWKDFQDMIRDILKEECFTIVSESGIGPDQGKDLIIKGKLKNTLEEKERKYLVQCKHKAKSSKNVSEKEIGSIMDKISQHEVEGYLIATSTDITSGLQGVIDGINKNEKNYFVGYWSKNTIEKKLIEHPNIYLQYMPKSYSKFYKIVEKGKSLHGYIEKKLPVEQSRKITKILVEDRDSPPYILHSTKPITFQFNDSPDMNLQFNMVNQEASNWITYHSKDSHGILKTEYYENIGRKIVNLYPMKFGEKFKLKYPLYTQRMYKKKFKLHFKTKHPFIFFIYVYGEDGKFYYIDYRSQKGKPKATSYGGVPYAEYFLGPEILDDKWTLLQRNIEKDLQKVYKIKSAFAVYFCFSVTGPFKIDYIELL
ncbi:MAG: restriction endonuclease [candidate division Zixibacteria bacterium]|nr:restriction endonuclease [candidate division Zixibacteria bacterium]